MKTYHPIILFQVISRPALSWCRPTIHGALGLVLFGLLASPASAAPLDSNAFTYQGRLTARGLPVNGPFDLWLALFRNSLGTNEADRVGTLTNSNVWVTNGLFTTTLDFGPAVFTGSPYWLEVAVRPSNLVGADFGDPLLPRQRITPAPYALYAANAGSLDWSNLAGVPAGFADGVDNNTLYSAGVGLILTGTVFQVRFGTNGDSAARGDHVHAAEEITSGILSAARLDPLVTRDSEVFPIVLANGGAGSGLHADLLDGRHADAFWQLGGNAGVGTSFLGTTDTNALEFKVNSARAFRLETQTNGPNVIGGANANGVFNGAGASSIGGGTNNLIGASYAHIGGGRDNLIVDKAHYAAIAGGFGARARSFGQSTHASGSFSPAFGEAQASVYVLRHTTMGNTTNEMFLDGTGERMMVPANGVWTFDVLVVAATANNAQTGGFQAQGIVKNDGSAVSLVGTNRIMAMPIPGSMTSTNWAVEISVPKLANPFDNESALVIRAGKSGPPLGQVIRWVATVRTAELIHTPPPPP